MDSTTYNVRVLSETLTPTLAEAVLDVCRAHLDETLPELNEGDRLSTNDHDVVFTPGESITVDTYDVVMGRRDRVFDALVTLVRSVDDECQIEVIEYSPETDENNTIMSTLVDDQENTEFTCFIDGTPGVSLVTLKEKLDAGKLEDFVRSEYAKLVRD